MSIYTKKFHFWIELELYTAAEAHGLTPKLVDSKWHGDHGTFSTELWQCDLGRLDERIVNEDWPQDWIDQLVVALRCLPGMLTKLHQIGIIHCDLSPYNIVIKRNVSDDAWDVAFIDFDISVRSNEQKYRDLDMRRLVATIHGIGNSIKKVICTEVGNVGCAHCEYLRRHPSHPRFKDV